MENFKQPYEISLWKEVNVEKEVYLTSAGKVERQEYEPGKYYSNCVSAGAAIYSIDYGVYDENKEYYVVSDSNTGIKGRISYFDEHRICSIGTHNLTS